MIHSPFDEQEAAKRGDSKQVRERMVVSDDVMGAPGFAGAASKAEEWRLRPAWWHQAWQRAAHDAADLRCVSLKPMSLR